VAFFGICTFCRRRRGESLQFRNSHAVKPHTKCKLRLLKMERLKDYLLMEEEFITNQERLKPQEEKVQVSSFAPFFSRDIFLLVPTKVLNICTLFFCVTVELSAGIPCFLFF